MSSQARENIEASELPSHRTKKAKLTKTDSKVTGASLFSKGMYCFKRQQFDKALNFFKEANENNDYPPAALFLAIMYLPSRPIWDKLEIYQYILKDQLESDKYALKCKKQLSWFTEEPFEQEAQGLNQFYLGLMYEFGIGHKVNLSKSFAHYKKAESLGNKDVLIYLARYFDGGVDRNLDEVFRYYKAAADNEDPEAQATLGNIYFLNYEIVVAQNKDGAEYFYQQAEDYYQQAVQNNSILGQRLLGLYLAKKCNDNPEKSDFSEAMRLFHLAAEAGDAVSQCLLGKCYELKKNHDQARMWFELAANQGVGRAQFKMSTLCLKLADGYYQDKAVEGIEWLKAAAANGNGQGQFTLAGHYALTYILKKEVLIEDFRTYTDIEVIPQNIKEAIRLYSLAAAQRYPGAKEKLTALQADPRYKKYFKPSASINFFAPPQPSFTTGTGQTGEVTVDLTSIARPS